MKLSGLVYNAFKCSDITLCYSKYHGNSPVLVPEINFQVFALDETDASEL
jgi:hypothetical protein